MNWSPSLIATGIWIVISSLLGLLELLLKYRWKDGRTKTHKRARSFLIFLFVVSSIFALVLALHDKARAETESKRLKQSLEEAANDRKIHAMTGRLTTEDGDIGGGQIFTIGNSGSTFVCDYAASFFDALPLPPPFNKISQQNFFIVSNNFAGNLCVSARICGRDGIVAEIINNEWKVAPSPRSWDRNYSSNALEVQNADGEIVFQVVIRKDFDGHMNVAHFQGIFFDSDGYGVGFTAGQNGGARMSPYRPNSGYKLQPIEPLFKYPSELHLGELAPK
jgi:hypothetical protein